MLAALDRAWPWPPLAALALAAVIAVVATLSASDPTPTEQIADTVEEFAAAVDERRGQDACALLTPAAARATAAGIGTLDCATVIRSFGYRLDTGPLRVATVRRADVSGPRATVPADALIVPGGRPYGPAIRLQRIEGRWRVAGFS